MEKETLLERWVREYSTDPQFVAEGLAIETIEQVIDKLGDRTQSWLADTLKVKRQQVSRMLNAPPNLTLLSIARLAIALGTKPRILFDFDAYFIQSLRDPYDIEEVVTELAMKGKRYPTWDAQQTVIPPTTPQTRRVINATE